MEDKHFRCMAQIGLLILVASISVLAQNPKQEGLKFAGIINAYSPQTSTGPYEVRGPWNLKVNGKLGTADFSAALNMVLSDGWVLTLGGGDFDPNGRGAHTHHISMLNAVVTPITGGFRVNGTATVTLNGSPAPVSPTPLEVDIVGGSTVRYSNVAMIFGAPGSNHFGTEPLPGVVRRVEK